MMISSLNLFRNCLFRTKFKRKFEKKIDSFSQTNQFAFIRKVQQTVYSVVLISGIVTISGVCYLILHEFSSRETPNGIFREASKICLADLHVQQALGIPIIVHRTPDMNSKRMNHVRAKIFDEKGHQSMTVSFYLTGQKRSGVVAVKVQKNISNKFIYDYILVQLDRPYQNQNILRLNP